MNERRERNKDKTVQDILYAAKELFSERGLNGTSFRDIEDASGVSKGLILHHFGSKENLYAAVQDLLIDEYVSMMAEQRKVGENLHEEIAAAVRNSFMHTKKNRAYRRISLWSYLEGQERNAELEERFTKALINAMRDGQANGMVREDIDAFLMPFIIKGTIEYWIRKDKLLRGLLKNEKEQKGDLDDQLMDALTRLFMK